jgi:hypothetical protein
MSDSGVSVSSDETAACATQRFNFVEYALQSAEDRTDVIKERRKATKAD